MIKKFIFVLITTLTLTLSVNAASDGELILKKNEPSEIKDCFEGLNRATFGFNQALDGIIFQPVANVYKKLPEPVKSGFSNSLDNLSILVTVPNNIIQGDLSQCDKYKTNGVTNYEKSGFYDVWFRLKGLEGVNHMEFNRDDCIRHPLVKRILKTYEDEHEIVL